MVSKIYRFDPELKGSDQLFVETSAWMAKMDKGLSDEDAEALSTWMAADPRNEKQLLAMAQMWDKMDALARLSEVFPHASGAVPQPVPRLFRRFAMAASLSVILVIGIAGPLLNPTGDASFSHPASGTTISDTAIGCTSPIHLRAGSFLHLHTTSRSRAVFSQQHPVLPL